MRVAAILASLGVGLALVAGTLRSPGAGDGPSTAADPTRSSGATDDGGSDQTTADGTTPTSIVATATLPPVVAEATSPSVVATATPPSVVARARPDPDAAPIVELANPTPIGAPLVFLAIGSDSAGTGEWLEVLLPVRPNGSTGWVERRDVELTLNPYRIEIDVEDHRLGVWRFGELWLEAPVGVGVGDTPTPTGRFYITELVQPPSPDGPYGPFAFGLSGYSETLEEFNGNAAVIGIHGTDDPSSLGGDVSHGCVRVDNDTIEQLASVLPLGTPVEISA